MSVEQPWLDAEPSQDAGRLSEQMVHADNIRARLRPRSIGQITHLMTDVVVACQAAERKLKPIEDGLRPWRVV